jgi:hypothetical protein
LAVLAVMANAVLLEEFDHKAPLSLFFMQILVLELLAFGLLCRLVVRMRNGGDPADAYRSQPFVDQMECLIDWSRATRNAEDQEKGCGEETS